MANLHNDNMSQQYLESKFTWRVLHVRTPKVTKITNFIFFPLSEYLRSADP